MGTRKTIREIVQLLKKHAIKPDKNGMIKFTMSKEEVAKMRQFYKTKE